jgi:hypothetical protein
MHIRAQGMKRDHPEQPQDHENYGDCPQHGYLPFGLFSQSNFMIHLHYQFYPANLVS